jgi:hypothetical protein
LKLNSVQIRICLKLKLFRIKKIKKKRKTKMKQKIKNGKRKAQNQLETDQKTTEKNKTAKKPICGECFWAGPFRNTCRVAKRKGARKRESCHNGRCIGFTGFCMNIVPEKGF